MSQVVQAYEHPVLSRQCVAFSSFRFATLWPGNPQESVSTDLSSRNKEKCLASLREPKTLGNATVRIVEAYVIGHVRSTRGVPLWIMEIGVLLLM